MGCNIVGCPASLQQDLPIQRCLRQPLAAGHSVALVAQVGSRDLPDELLVEPSPAVSRSIDGHGLLPAVVCIN